MGGLYTGAKESIGDVVKERIQSMQIDTMKNVLNVS